MVGFHPQASNGADEALKAFRNTVLGETWLEAGDAPEWQRLYDRREHWEPGTVPAGGLFLTAGVDVQKLRERNEALDCRVYARAAAWIAGADRTSEEGWAELERRVHDHEKHTTEGSSRPRARRRRVGRVGGAHWTYG